MDTHHVLHRMTMTHHLTKLVIQQRSILPWGMWYPRYTDFNFIFLSSFYIYLHISWQYLPLPDTPVPKATSKVAYGRVHLHHVAGLWDLLHTSMALNPVKSKFPMTFEAMGQSQGFVLYCTRVFRHFSDPALLELKGLADRAYIYIDKVLSLLQHLI